MILHLCFIAKFEKFHLSALHFKENEIKNGLTNSKIIALN